VERTPRRVFEKLVRQAEFCWLKANPDDRRLRVALEREGQPPDDVLPGRLVMRLSPQERKTLKGLTADMTQDRMP